MFGSTIKSIRTRKGLTQEEFADKLGTTAHSVSRWENNKAVPIRFMAEIEKEFGEFFLSSTSAK